MFGNNILGINTLNNYWDFADSLILKKDGSVFSIFEIPSQVIVTIDDKGRENFKETTFFAFERLKKYKDFEIYSIPRFLDVEDIFAKFESKLTDDENIRPLADMCIEYAKEQIEESSQDGQYQYKHYIVVPLKSINVSPDFLTTVKESFNYASKTALSLVGKKMLPPVDWYKEWQLKRDMVTKELIALSPRIVKKEELAWLARSQFLRGQLFTEEEKEREVKAVTSYIGNVDDTNIYFDNHKALELQGRYENTYVGVFPIAYYPRELSYNHLQEELQRVNFPVESIYKVRFSATRGTNSVFAKVKRKRKNLTNTVNEIDEGGDIQKLDVLEAHEDLIDYQERVESKESMVEYLHFLVVTGEDVEEVESKWDVLNEVLASLGVELAKAYADRMYFFYKGRFGEVMDKRKESFIQYSTLEGFCETLLFTDKKVGTDYGFPIARINSQVASWGGDLEGALESSNKFVFFNPLEANKQNVEGKITNSPHIAITGATGSGKSFLTKTALTLMSFLKVQTLYIDPKAEIRRNYLSVRETLGDSEEDIALRNYIDSIHFVTLDMNNDDYIGLLDPFAFCESRNDTESLARVLLSSTLGTEVYEREVKVNLTDIFKVVFAKRERGETVGMLTLFEEFLNSDDENMVKYGKYLISLSENSLLRLCFSDGTNNTLDYSNHMTVFEIKDLDLPSTSNREEMTEFEKHSLTVMYSLAKFCSEFGKRDSSIETITFLDEAWQIMATPVGRQIVAEMKRTGRSFNNFLVVVSQSVLDAETEDEKTAYGTLFTFSETSETSAILERLRVEENDLSRAWVENQMMGQCIMSDTFGRKESILIDGTLYPMLTPLYKTVTTKYD